MKLGWLAGASILLVASVAHAQTPTVPYQPAFDVERLQPSPSPGTFIGVEDGDVIDRGDLAARATLALETRPIVIYDVRTGAELTVPVSARTTLDLGAVYGLGHDAEVGLALPIVVYQTGDRLAGLGLPGGERGLGAVALGDARLYGKWRVVAPPGGLGQAWSAELVATLPTGDDQEFAGEAGVIVELRLAASYRARRFALAANLGPRFRAQEVRFIAPETTLGDEVAFGLAGSVVVPGARGAEAVVELAGARGDHGISPVEVRAGVRVPLGHGLALTFHVGAGLDRDIGAPGVRGGVSLAADAHPRRDSDGDGVPDARDRCPTVPEDLDGFEDEDGCPDLDDDADGVPDADDQCPDQKEDRDAYLDDDGCPDPDNDGDHVLDDVDPCPNDADDRCEAAPASQPESQPSTQP
jgi:hypothetical protein